ncbi:MAG: helix-turn-helix domain-containing protein [Oscillospiraceae bacterium]|nr:helix-turn-helix domain-containing protein [Oscillospiraceae bacterium]MBR6377394.1 helix-turn-helix domain-containing protein [Oscillospiraceae bacterium]
MDHTMYRTLEEFPVFLNADHLAGILGISRTSAYKLMQAKGFPTLPIGKRMVVPRDKFINWVNEQTGGC